MTSERPATRPELLRQVADWLDLIDPLAVAYMRTQPASTDRDIAIACVEGKEMQTDLRQLADDMEDGQVPFDSGWVKLFYVVPEWTEGGREAAIEQRRKMGLSDRRSKGKASEVSE